MYKSTRFEYLKHPCSRSSAQQRKKILKQDSKNKTKRVNYEGDEGL